MPFENENYRESYKRYYLPTAEIKDYNVMICGRNCPDQPVKSDLTADDNVQKVATCKGDDLGA